ncbi:MAG: hypothetical protein R3Y33_00075 [Clostridia bacterium]
MKLKKLINILRGDMKIYNKKQGKDNLLFAGYSENFYINTDLLDRKVKFFYPSILHLQFIIILI